MRAFILFPVLAIALVLALPVGAVQRYQAHYEKAEWSVEREAGRCAARQFIPRYGEAAFVQSAGGGLEFRLNAYHRPPQTQSVEVRTETPEWRGEDGAERLGALPLEPEGPVVQVAQGAALMLLLELEAGRMPVLAYADWTRPESTIEVAVSPIRFLPAVQAFRECLAELPPPLSVAVAQPAQNDEAELAAGGPVDTGATMSEQADAAAEERRRQLKYRILSGGPDDEVRILLPEEAGAAGEPGLEPAPPEPQAIREVAPAEAVPADAEARPAPETPIDVPAE